MLDVQISGLAPEFVPYADGLALQRYTHAQVIAGQRPDTLLLLEHEPVFTAGKRTEPQERPQDGTPVVDVDRGGKITWHGPGQLVGYPIVRLAEPIDVVSHVRRLERLLMMVLAEWGVESYQVDGRSGVWVAGERGENKIAAIGVRVEKGTTLHGFALNCSNSLDGFSQIIPCGIADAGVTTISQVCGRTVEPCDVLAGVVSVFRDEYAGVTA